MERELTSLFSFGLMILCIVPIVLGYSKGKDFLFAGGIWVFLGSFCVIVGAAVPPFNWQRFYLALAGVALLLVAAGLLLRMRLIYVIALIWVWFWFTIVRGWRAGTPWLGLPMIILSTILIPTLVLYYISSRLLPLEGREQRVKAFRAFLTTVAGTNYPYYMIHEEEWGREKVRLQTQMKGSAFGAMLAGPGVVMSRCDHAPVISDGVYLKGIKTPGVNFTGFADSVPQAVDLRVQLRAFFVEARTRDGIGIKVLAFTPFRIDSGSETPRLGEPFPFRRSAAFLATHMARRIEHEGKGQIEGRIKERLWDELPPLLGERILRDIIAEYRFDDLCAPYQLSKDPRIEIATTFKKRLGEELSKWGIHLVGGGISNLLPAEKNRREIYEQRIRRWQVHWVRHVMEKQADGQRSRLRQIEKARAQAQVETIQAISDRLSRLEDTHTAISSEEVSALLIDVIQQMAVRPMVRRLLPEDATEVVDGMAPGQPDAAP